MSANLSEPAVDEERETQEAPMQASQRRAKPSFSRRHGERLIALAAVTAFLVAWELLGRSGIVPPLFISRPSAILGAAVEYFGSGNAWADIRVSGTEFGLGYVASAVTGVTLGLAMGWYRWLHAALDPFVTFLFSTPRVAFLPLLIIWLGVGIWPKVALVYIMSVLPLIIAVISGVQTVDKDLVRVGTSFGASNLQIFRTIVLPATVPSIISGLRVGIGTGLIGMVVGELYAANKGLGFRIVNAGQLFRIDLVFVCVFVISGTAVVLSKALAKLETRLGAWRA